MLNILSGVCLLLWGLRNVKDGMAHAFGADLHRFIAISAKNRITAFFSGIGVTALLQSSTATAFIIAAFCGQGVLTLSAGLAVMLGADVGTAVVAQLLSYDLSWLAPMFIILGYILYSRYEKRGRLKHVGKLLVGLALMLFALMWIKDAALPLKESELLSDILSSLDKDPIMAVLLIAVLTWIAHSSLAIVLLLSAFVLSELLPTDVALVMVLGANIGGAIVPIFATLKDKAEAARVPVGNLMMRLIAAIIVMPFLPIVHDLLISHGSTPERIVVDFHIAFNLALAMAFLPFTPVIAMLSSRLVPETAKEEDPSRPLYLDENELDTPAVALSGATRETLRMAEYLQEMIEETIVSLRDNDEVLMRKIKEQDDILDGLHTAIKMYMSELTQHSLDPEEAARYVQILGYSQNLESAGDTIDKSLMDMVRKKISNKTHFSKQGWKEISEIHEYVAETHKLGQSLFVSKDVSLARRLLERKEELRLKEQEASQKHMERIKEGVPETIATSSLHLDIIRDYRRVNSYVTSVAYHILEEEGMLRSSRLRKQKHN